MLSTITVSSWAKKQKRLISYRRKRVKDDYCKELLTLIVQFQKNLFRIIVDKIDKDGDGQITQDELKNWIQYTQKKYIQDDIENQWKTHVPVNDNKLMWETYKKTVYGFMENMDQSELAKEEHGASYVQMLKRDRRRWQMADQDEDDALTKEEFAGFLHPEEIEHMKGIVVVETMEDIDKDKDGKVSLEEYIGLFSFSHNSFYQRIQSKIL